MDRRELLVKKRLLMAAPLLVLTPSAALAADWDGFYLGVQLGQAEVRDSNNELDGMVYGFSGGYNWMATNKILLGLEASWIDGKVEQTAPVGVGNPSVSAIGQHDIGNIITIGPRLGYVENDLLIYGEAGYASSDINTMIAATAATTAQSFSSTADGFFFGVGFEYAINGNLFFGAEYNHIEYSSFEHGGTVVDNADSGSIVVQMKHRFE